MKDANSKDATDMLAAQLIAAQLNIAKFGAGTSDILQIISDSNDFLILHPVGSDPQGDDRTDAIELKDLLDKYNNLNDCDFPDSCSDCDDKDRDKGEDR